MNRRLLGMILPTLTSSTLVLGIALWAAADRSWWGAIPCAFMAALGYVVTAGCGNATAAASPS
jgi:Na+-translocating ferredoxin:NAD+ oxidoreductase RnfA subunit